MKKILKDWRETLSDTDGIKTNLEPFWQTQSGKGLRRLTSSDPSKGRKQDESTTWYSGENTDIERYLPLLINDLNYVTCVYELFRPIQRKTMYIV